MAAIEPQLRRFLDFDCGENSAILENNYDWMSKFGYLEFLRDVGKHFPVNVMLAKDSVRSRLERTDSGLSYTEFSYMLLQAFDFVHLHDAHGCELQVGGSDQWGNITAGIDLARRLRGVQLYGMTCPLLTTSSGAKMGKTAAGALWLDAQRTSPYHFYQYWINLDDADVPGCLRYFTDLGREEIAAVMTAHEADPGRREAHRRLADEVTRFVHGEDGLAKAQAETEVFFRGGGAAKSRIMADLTVQREVSRTELDGDGFPVIDAFVAGGLAKTKSDVRRLIKQGGAYVNDERVQNIEACLTTADLTADSTVLLRAGKKNYAVLRFSE